MSFSEQIKKEVWNKARKEEGFDESKYRKDACGAWIKWDKYGDTEDIYGWEIDHIYPQSMLENKSLEEINNLQNLRALQWENNRSKDDNYPSYMAKITSEGNKNIEKESALVVNKETQERIAKIYNL